jgi:hypothetical protein
LAISSAVVGELVVDLRVVSACQHRDRGRPDRD